MTKKWEEQIVASMICDGAPEIIARRQVERVQSGQRSDLALSNRVGAMRTFMDDEPWYELFDAVESAKNWDNLDEKWRSVLVLAESQFSRGT